MKFKLTNLIAFVFVGAIFFCAATQTFACMCPYIDKSFSKDGVKQAQARATVVFTAEVVSIDFVKTKDSILTSLPLGGFLVTLPEGKYEVTFRVSKVWKGSETTQIKMVTNTSMCDFNFEKGKTYLVYASGEVNALSATICSRTAVVEGKNLQKEIKALNKLKNEN